VSNAEADIQGKKKIWYCLKKFVELVITCNSIYNYEKVHYLLEKKLRIAGVDVTEHFMKRHIGLAVYCDITFELLLISRIRLFSSWQQRLMVSLMTKRWMCQNFLL